MPIVCAAADGECHTRGDLFSVRGSAVASETACPHAVELTKEAKNGLRAGRLQNSASTLQRLLASLFRFCSQRELTGQGIENFRVPERPGIINRHSLEAPLVAIPHQVAIVAIHQ